MQIYPLIVIVCSETGRHHAVLGYWNDEESALNNLKPIISGNKAAEYVKDSKISVVNSTRIPPDEYGKPKKFEEAVNEAGSYMPHITKGQRILFATDVRAARTAGVLSDYQPISVFHNPLPSREPNFVGRKYEKEELLSKIFSGANIINVYGLQGVGKTALALEVVHGLLKQQLFEAIIWIDLKPKPLTLDEILTTIARAFKETDTAVKPFPEKSEEIRELMENYRCLLILDSFDAVKDDVHFLDFLSKLPQPSKTLLTSLERLSFLDMELKGMNQPEALEFIRLEAKRINLKKKITNADKIYDLCGGVPYAMRLSVGLVKDGLSDVAVEKILTVSKLRPDFWQELLGKTWDRLSSEARNILLATSVFPAPLFDESLMAISVIQGQYFFKSLTQLVRMSLLEPSEEERIHRPKYSIEHPLVRSFGDNKLKECSHFESKIIRNAEDYYFKLLKEYSNDLREGYAVIDAEVNNILHLLEYLNQNRQYENILDILELFSYFLYDMGYWNERLKWSKEGYKAALFLAEEQKDRKEYHRAAKCAYWTGWFYCRGAQYDEAREWADKTHECFKKAGIKGQEPRVTQLLGMIEFGADCFSKAEQLFKKAIDGFNRNISNAQTDEERENKLFWLVTVKTNLGDLAKVRGDTEKDLKLYQEAGKWYNDVLQEAELKCYDSRSEKVVRYDRWTGRLARTYGSLGDVYRRQGKVEQAIKFYEKGYEIAKEVRYLNTIGACAIGLGLLLWDKADRRSIARELLREGLDIFRQLGSRALGEKQALKEAEKLLKQPLR